MALAHALTLRGQKTIVTDSRYVHDTVHKLKQGIAIAGAHGDLWQFITTAIHTLREIHWVKAHLTEEEALQRNIPAQHWALNQQADSAATQGLSQHTEDPGAITLYRW